MTKSHSPAIQVAGDSIAYWMLLVPPSAADPPRITVQPGGAALLSKLIARVDTRIDVLGPVLPRNALVNSRSTAVARTFSIWQQHRTHVDSKEFVWRMSRILGDLPASANRASPPSSVGDIPACLVIDDANPNLGPHGFRVQHAAWPSWLKKPAGRSVPIILKMGRPLANGPLWQHLAKVHSENLTVYCSVQDLREEYASISQPLSWERTASDVVKAVTHGEGGDPPLAQAAQVIVSLGLAGAVVLERGGESPMLIFDPLHQEHDWESERPGIPVGLGPCLVASLAIEHARSPVRPNWCLKPIEKGLRAARSIHQFGFKPDNHEPSGLQFPWKVVTDTLSTNDPTNPFQHTAIDSEDKWRIFTSVAKNYHIIAWSIVLNGATEACRGLPLEQMGSWASVDRNEIESIRSVRNIISEYVAHIMYARGPDQPGGRIRPLNLAVFGRPGSGKSFAIKQLAREWHRDRTKIEVVEFNLSQFTKVAELIAGLQRVRDYAVEGLLPLVFWDEFDAPLGEQKLGWLAHFLAPMEDGEFMEPDTLHLHPLGPAIFVFAGGTHSTMNEFKRSASREQEDGTGTKAMDFISRLRGFVDILGPDRVDDSDETYQLRRALLLRAILSDRAPQLFSSLGRLAIDRGVLRAFLDISNYSHGARSMRSIIDMSSLAGSTRFERSALPADHQLDLHVNAAEFLNLVTENSGGGTPKPLPSTP